ncbi:endo-alpha-15-arabinanase precursor [Pyrenophora tritici-repentis]|uniref:Arabinan endo-1,5-alpha-L-arabinosidase n=2 Tax=Pyrenophora tritici-repentis TaxID=45151 RepID=A0A2W1G1R4_9PLEO|nr:endo-alpha-1,5-arabinanase precursor [Pyrenophora tritici-repentis Pt-1C-BFP]KAA8617831.1 Arabinan endo-1 5-alpha-L-arabinosidase [Pyrenophora tritici-repentis]EDU42696.1 endo-alpha-1,5-arabinanase precursor [Pyrenophora tritici-repentis Pt-1C-BFP]KAF7443220.1 Arabinan endo-1-5-alpha-L-arabinosidase [Pyrenophora tritici-repentis]KAF7568309.1 Glyco-hydro-43 domain containing protein [Pyrenophora tritici-repentis]KAG9377096.1 Arabinan endo-1,5-alpha-L-arabinosidase [Pyrenophora tritici-repent
MRCSIVVSILSVVTAVYGYADPMACSGVCTNAHDPALIRRADGTYYRFSTGGKIAIHTAPSITGPWTYKGAAIPAGSKINLAGKDDLWAPDVTLVGDTYYLYYSVSSFGVQNSAIGVATSKDLNTWTDHGATGIASSAGKNYNAIDGALYWDGSKFVMSFGSFWSDIFSINMANPPLKTSSSTMTNIAFKPGGTHAQEGPYIALNGNYHYLFFSVGQCCGFDSNRPAAGQEYKIQVCRSRSATGGFVDKNGVDCTKGGGTTVLESHGWVYGPGGQGVYYDPKLGPVLYYHYVDTRIGYADGQKKFGINRINFSSGWPVV